MVNSFGWFDKFPKLYCYERYVDDIIFHQEMEIYKQLNKFHSSIKICGVDGK